MGTSGQNEANECTAKLRKARAQLRRVRSELTAVREILINVNAFTDARAILDNIAQTTTRIMRVDSTSIYLLDNSSQRLILKATTGLFPRAVDHDSLEMGQGLTGWSAQHRQMVAVRDAQADPRFYELPNTRERSFRSLMAAPLVSQDRVVGALNVQTVRLHTWTKGEKEFLLLISEMVAGILERAILQEQTEHRMRELQAVAEVSRAAISPLYLDEMLRVVAEMGAHAVGARHCSVLLLDETRDVFVPRGVWDQRGDVEAEPIWSRDSSLLAECCASQKPLIAQINDHGLPEAHTRWAIKSGLYCLISVPMMVRDRVIGLLNMWSDRQTAFAKHQIELCVTLANQIALSIENAHLIGNAAIIKEMNHRVKNNLQNVVMLLQMQLYEIQNNPSAARALRESISRIMSIAAVHDAMAQEGFRLVDVKDVVTRVVGLTHANMTRPDLKLSIHVMGDSLRMNSRAATALALCVNELVQNAVEHAFVGRSQGTITVSLANKGNSLEVEVRDNGVGSDVDLSQSNSLGLSIVKTLIQEDLRGTFTLESTAEGSVATIRAPFSFGYAEATY